MYISTVIINLLYKLIRIWLSYHSRKSSIDHNEALRNCIGYMPNCVNWTGECVHLPLINCSIKFENPLSFQ